MRETAAPRHWWTLAVDCLKWAGAIIAVLFLLLVLLAFGGLPGQLAFLMVFGWADFLRSVLPSVVFNREIALDSLVALFLGMGGLHWLLRWWPAGKALHPVWKFRWTLQIVAMALLLFATSIAAVGIVHQAGWLFGVDPWITNGRGHQTIQLSNMKKLGLALRTYADEHNDRFPSRLDDLVPEILQDRRLFFTTPNPGEPPEPVLYFSGYRSTDSPDLMLLASPRAMGGVKRVVIYVDISGAIERDSDFQEQVRKQATPGALKERIENPVPGKEQTP